MNAGLSSLAALKKYLLAAALQSGNDYDDSILAIGLGVASGFENFSNRKFTRQAGAVEILQADRCQFLLSRYPMESLTSVDLKMKESDGWVAQDLVNILSIDLGNGIINYPERADLGPWFAQVRFTYTGGFWWDDTDDGSGVRPPTSIALPADLQLAWLEQCAHLWKIKDKLGLNIVATEDKPERISAAALRANLLPDVESKLSQYVRFNLT